MRVAVIESPYAAPDDDRLRRNILYARLLCRWAFEEGYAPFASHLLYTQPGILDDDDPEERAKGIDAGLSLVKAADITIMGMDLGESRGMKYGRKAAVEAARPIQEVRLFDGDDGLLRAGASYLRLQSLAYHRGLLPGDVYGRRGW